MVRPKQLRKNSMRFSSLNVLNISGESYFNVVNVNEKIDAEKLGITESCLRCPSTPENVAKFAPKLN